VNTPNKCIKVSVITPSPTFRIGLGKLLGSEPDIKIVTEAGSLEFVNAIRADTDVLILAFWDLPFTHLYRFDQDLQIPCAILVLTNLAFFKESFSLPSTRTIGLIPIDSSSEQIIAAVRALNAGLWVGLPSNPAVDNRWIAKNGDDNLLEPLTDRELEVLQLLSQGLPNKQIALKLGISENTVKFHLSSIFSKMGVSSRTEAVRVGARLGWISL